MVKTALSFPEQGISPAVKDPVVLHALLRVVEAAAADRPEEGRR